jgi:hypothetical protein
LFSIPFPRLALLVFFFGVVSTKGGRSSNKDESDGITSIQLDCSRAVCKPAYEVDGSQGIDQLGRKIDREAASRGVIDARMLGFTACERATADMVVGRVKEGDDGDKGRQVEISTEPISVSFHCGAFLALHYCAYKIKPVLFRLDQVKHVLYAREAYE